jgi:hypothetical protein
MIRAAAIADQPATNNGKLVEAGRAEAEPGRFHHYCERNGQMPKSMAGPSVQVVVSGLQNERSWQVLCVGAMQAAITGTASNSLSSSRAARTWPSSTTASDASCPKVIPKTRSGSLRRDRSGTTVSSTCGQPSPGVHCEADLHAPE